jgi:hypothetical protein
LHFHERVVAGSVEDLQAAVRQRGGDRLGLLLREAAAGLTAQQLHLVGEPWRPRS